MSDATATPPVVVVDRHITSLDAARLRRAKGAFTTRNVDPLRHPEQVAWSLIEGVRPHAGDLVLAEVTDLGQHKSIERTDGRRSTLYVGDEVVVAYGARYAPDQFEGVVPADLGPCDLLAAGGIAGKCVAKSSKVNVPTKLRPLGLLAANGQRLDLRRFATFPTDEIEAMTRPRHTIAVVGTSMNSGKTTALAALGRGLTRAGLRVGAAKVTGTGAGPDLWSYTDAGVEWVCDFTDAGYATTYQVPIPELERVASALVDGLARRGADVVLVEIADGILQQETAGLLASPVIRLLLDGVIFASGDALGAHAGVERVRAWGYDVRAAGGLLTVSPLAIREAASLGIDVLSAADLADPSIATKVAGVLAESQQAS
ncbi:hypothetical protein [Tenggerimyces flavus]|uniref:DUF1611 domain-containing protein n=1 Tax=Tenggerimyces flavus TaxID=1708749 RepID=A0ABV7YDU9_9ACTN|nr:hypothetical protein [Tenggerimyces flavus]MBM7784244.1 hypothetical protein [Tenggerimyces flavus]